MANIKLINSVKYSKSLYKLYRLVGNFSIKVLKLFLKPDPKLIVFVSSGGKLMNDSPKCIYDYIRKDDRFSDCKLVWAFRDTSKFDVPTGKKIQLDSFSYYYYLLKARVWITNVSMTRGLSFSGIHTFLLNSWHGSAIKKIGLDIIDKQEVFTLPKKEKKNKNKRKSSENFLFLAQSEHDVFVWQRAFHIKKDNISTIGLPRNDELYKKNKPEIINDLKSKLGFPLDKKIIMYAPTFRDYQKKDGKYFVFSPPIDFKKWEKELANKYVILFRAHPSVVEIMDIREEDTFVKDFSSYSNVNDLMLISDIMISDYSSILFDYSILERPILCFAYDYDTYATERGLYFDIREALDSKELREEQDLLNAIKNMDFSKRIDTTISFRKKYVQYYGNATQKAVDIVYSKINNNSISVCNPSVKTLQNGEKNKRKK